MTWVSTFRNKFPIRKLSHCKKLLFQLDFNDKLNFSPQLLSSDKQVNTSIPQGGNRRREDKSFGNYSEIGNKEKLQKNRST